MRKKCIVSTTPSTTPSTTLNTTEVLRYLHVYFSMDWK